MIDESYIANVNKRVTELETQLSNPTLSSDRKKFTALLQEHSHQKKLQAHTKVYFALIQAKNESEEIINDPESDDDLREIATEELAEIDEKLPQAEKDMQFALLPPDPTDASNAIVEIRAGTGGDEAGLFAGDLYRMYTRFAEVRGWKTSLMDANASEVGGYKEIIFSIEGEDVFKQMKYESGVHRVQRVPATEASGRIHTSAATVAVLPETAEAEELELKAEEIRVDFFRSSGPGGQSVNTTDSAVRITHLPTGEIAQCQDEKSQHKNRAQAMRILKVRVQDRYRREEDAKLASERRSQIGSGDRSERIRTYNYPQNRLTDHRINLTLYSLDRVVEGGIQELISALYENDMALKVKAALEK
ncbi:MAG: peptide chain release factor 1 [Candidatus Omnitrophota bacterium]|jgi:peptide chain release factor 1